jgi:ABC-type glycerol-3-phosphate transport system substrate-binding protein
MAVRSRVRTSVVIAVAFGLAACSASPSTDPSPTPTASASTTVERNLLSGRPGINGPVLAVKIDDTSAAHPQIGLEVADVVYV